MPISIMSHIMCDKQQLSYAFFDNLRVPMLLKRKLRLIMENTLIKVRAMKGCCGNYDEPGC